MTASYTSAIPRTRASNGDVIPCKTIRIARSVPSFVVMADHVEFVFHEPKALAHRIAADGMSLHDPSLLRGQPVRLVENVIRHLDLSDIVHDAALSEGPEHLTRQPHRFAEAYCTEGHTVGMPRL